MDELWAMAQDEAAEFDAEYQQWLDEQGFADDAIAAQEQDDWERFVAAGGAEYDRILLEQDHYYSEDYWI
jgi:hypothetical protein